MRKRLTTLFIVALVVAGSIDAQVPERVQLPDPQRTGGMPLMEALDKRQSMRSFSQQELSKQLLSNILWAAYGINREDGRRTAPSARNYQPFDIYLIMADGWYMYEPGENALHKLGNDDLREDAGTQDYVATAPLNLIFVSDYDRLPGSDDSGKYITSSTDVGFISQNVYLYCASEGLATVVRGLVDRDLLKEVLRLRPSQHVVLGQSVGYPGN